ncbi:MAG: DUF86 domain-containing protein [Methanoregulaceae archaeon]|nr:DUF86 domain-containing protein [Methanoregulaceae archaeon]
MNESQGETRENVLIALNAKFPVMKRLFGIKKIGIFGSLARGTIRPDSDIDIEVEFDQGTENWQNFIGLAGYLEDLFGRKVDLVTRRVLDDFLSDDIDADRIDRTRDRLYISRMTAEFAFLSQQRKDLDFRTFSRDEVVKRAALRSIQVIGECASLISPELQQSHPEIPWTELQGMRTRFTPRYFNPDWVLVWNLIDSGIPVLEPKIRSLAATF